MITGRSVPIVDRVTDAFFALDEDWRFTYLNERAATLLKRSREDLLGRVVWDEFPETVETQFPDGFHRAMDEQVPVSFEVYHQPLETWLEARAYPSETGVSVFMRDVTDRKEREDRLARHDAVVEAVREGVVTLDEGNRIASMNEALERSLDVDREALIGEHVEALLDAASVDAQEAIDFGQAIDEVAAGKADHRTIEIGYVDASGEDRAGELRVVPVDHGSAVVAGIVRDVTEQREYERVVTSLHQVTRWLLGADDPEEICAIAVHAGSDLLDLPISGAWLLDDETGTLDPVAGTAGAHDEFGGLPRFSQGEGLVWDVFEAGETERYDDLRDVDGVYNPETPLRSEIIAPIGTHGVLMTGALEPDAFDDTDLELVSTLVENTRAALDRAERERMLRDRTERLERQRERLEAVATVLSNDLKRQLEAIDEALDETPAAVGDSGGTPDDDAEQWVFPLAEDDVTRTLRRAERLVDDVREFARDARSTGPRVRIDLETAIGEAVASSRIESASVVFEESATLRVDPERFGHMLETVFNDVADRSDGDVTVQVGLCGVEEGDDGSRGFFVLEDATEIPPGAHERVLDPRADDADDGLGLAVARAIAEAHDWSVSITNGRNGGTRFEVRDVTTLETP